MDKPTVLVSSIANIVHGVGVDPEGNVRKYVTIEVDSFLNFAPGDTVTLVVIPKEEEGGGG